MLKVRSHVVKIGGDDVVDINALSPDGVIDFSVKNTGATDVSVNGFVLKVGDGMLSFPGYELARRTDLLDVDFVGGIGELTIIYTAVFCG